MLRLEAEQKCGCEVSDILHTDLVVRGPGVEVTVSEGYQEPEGGEDQPGEVESGAEPQQGPRPGQVNH